MVSWPTLTIGGRASKTKNHMELYTSVPHEVPSGAGYARATSLEIIQQQQRQAIMKTMQFRLHHMSDKSSTVLYHAKYSTFCHWCHGSVLSPRKATVQQIAEISVT